MLQILKKLFKKNNLIDNISDKIIDSRKRGIKYFTINLWIDNQILFQNGPGEHFIKHGIDVKSDKEIFAIHFFNKNKTLTTKSWEKFKNDKNSNYVNFTSTDGNDYYIKSMGIDSFEVMKNIKAEIELYEIKDKSRIGIQFVEQ